MNEVRAIRSMKSLSKEEFMEKYNNEELYTLLHNSKEGHIKITKLSDNPGYLKDGEWREGETSAFGEGLALHLENPDEWYHTSTIQSINWEDNTFKTLNSTYKFEFNGSKD